MAASVIMYQATDDSSGTLSFQRYYFLSNCNFPLSVPRCVLDLQGGREGPEETLIKIGFPYNAHSLHATTFPFFGSSQNPSLCTNVSEGASGLACLTLSPSQWHRALEWDAQSSSVANFLGSSGQLESGVEVGQLVSQISANWRGPARRGGRGVMKGHASAHLIGLLIASLRGWIGLGRRGEDGLGSELSLDRSLD